MVDTWIWTNTVYSKREINDIIQVSGIIGSSNGSSHVSWALSASAFGPPLHIPSYPPDHQVLQNNVSFVFS